MRFWHLENSVLSDKKEGRFHDILSGITAKLSWLKTTDQSDKGQKRKTETYTYLQF